MTMLNDSIHYVDDQLYCDGVPVQTIVEHAGTPVYIYSLKRAVQNYKRLEAAFQDFDAHIHYSAKANANLAVLRALIDAGAGVDAVSGGEIYKALMAGAKPANVVFAGVGKTPDDIRYAVEQGVGWFNVENVAECRLIDQMVEALGRKPVRVALRLNPEVTANTHPYIATGHGGAKFGLTAETIRALLANQADYPNLEFAGLHVHIGSQLGDTDATRQAIEVALELLRPYPHMRTLNMGGGLPVVYQPGDDVPPVESFAAMLKPLVGDYQLLLEPGRVIIADAGMLVSRVLYIKQQAGQSFAITDASMTELIRPSLYQAYHEVVPVQRQRQYNETLVQVVGPVCETADVLARDRKLPELQPGDFAAVLTAGAYGMVMASNYNARPRPPEVVVEPDGQSWHVARRRETWDDLLRFEQDETPPS